MNQPTDDDALSASDEPPSSLSRPCPGASQEIDIEFAAPDVDPPADGWLQEHLAAAIRGAGVGAVTLGVRVVDDAEMDRLHRLHSGVPGTTDVLTFDNRDAPDEPIAGDLVLCRDEAHRRARELGHDARLELLLYALHGVLHLDGEDDHDPLAHRRMHEREDRVLAALGLGPVFFRGGGPQ